MRCVVDKSRGAGGEMMTDEDDGREDDGGLRGQRSRVKGERWGKIA